MASSLPVRNLTSVTFRIKRIERFQDPNTLQSKNTGSLFSSRNTLPAAPTSPQLGEHAQSFNHRDLDIALAPFEAYTINQPGPERDDSAPILSSTTIRLTIETSAGERYRVDTNPSYTQKLSQSLTPLSSHASTGYTALFHPSRPISHLTIHENHLPDYAKWMATLPDTLPLSALSIPGTHNSHTHYRALPSVRCQLVDIKAQLQHGIRFLDIRMQPVHATDRTKKDLYLVHGAFPISLTGPKYLAPVLQTCYDFLTSYPSETILISLKREGVGSATDEHLACILDEYYIAPNAGFWHTGARIPYLRDVRGKLVLIRRYTTTTTTTTTTPQSDEDNKPHPPGLDATSWPYNATHALFPSSASPVFCLQDFCEILLPSAIAHKLQYANEHLVRAAECTHFIPGFNTDTKNPVPPGPLYLNFLSGSNFWKRACWPEVIAREVNRGMEEWVCRGHHVEGEEVEEVDEVDEVDGEEEEGGAGAGAGGENGRGRGGVKRARQGDGGTGVVVMDCVGEGGDWDLVRLIVGMNMGVLMKIQAGSGD